MQRIVENIIRKMIGFEANLILDDVLKKTLSANILSKKLSETCKFFYGRL